MLTDSECYKFLKKFLSNKFGERIKEALLKSSKPLTKKEEPKHYDLFRQTLIKDSTFNAKIEFVHEKMVFDSEKI